MTRKENGVKKMKVEAVSNLGFRNNNFSFGEKQRVHENVPVESSNKASDLAKVPVIVLLTMNPATLNSAIPVMPETDNPNNIVMLAPEQKSVDKNTYVIAPELQDIQQINPPYGWEHFRFGKIQHSSNVVVDGKYNRDLVFYTPVSMKRQGNVVGEVFIVDPNKPGGHLITPHPPKIEKIIYHDIGKDKEFCSVKTVEFLVDDSGNSTGYADRELRIDDDSANKLMALTLNKLEWKDATHIDFIVTKTADLAEPKIVY
jgi:hypothetical protein